MGIADSAPTPAMVARDDLPPALANTLDHIVGQLSLIGRLNSLKQLSYNVCISLYIYIFFCSPIFLMVVLQRTMAVLEQRLTKTEEMVVAVSKSQKAPGSACCIHM